MKKKNALTVKPLRRYNTPVYPSYLDKNPIEHPDTLPYPFSYKALQALAAAGILVGSSCAPTKKAADNSPDIQLNIAVQDSSVDTSGIDTLSEFITQQTDSLFNPFAFENLGVPFMPASFGTGLPARLRSDEARTTINKVFEEQGIQLTKNYFYKKDSIAVALDGFNPDLNIGYVWVTWNNMGEGMTLNNWDALYYDYIDGMGFINYGVEYISYLESSIEGFLRDKKYNKQFHESFEAIKKIEIDENKLLALKEMYLDIMAAPKNKNQYPNTRHYREKLTSDSSFQEKKKAYHNDLLMEGVKYAARYIEENTTILQIADSILQLKNEEEAEKQYNNLMAFLDINADEHYDKIENGPTKKILAIKDKTMLAGEIQAFGYEHLHKKLSLKEAEYLENIHDTEKDFIAPIGERDKRFSYHYGGMPELTSQELEKLAKIRETQGQDAYMKAHIEFINAAEKRDLKDEALKALETQVRQYIQWAKEQGGY